MYSTLTSTYLYSNLTEIRVRINEVRVSVTVFGARVRVRAEFGARVSKCS